MDHINVQLNSSSNDYRIIFYQLIWREAYSKLGKNEASYNLTNIHGSTLNFTAKQGWLSWREPERGQDLSPQMGGETIQ